MKKLIPIILSFIILSGCASEGTTEESAVAESTTSSTSVTVKSTLTFDTSESDSIREATEIDYSGIDDFMYSCRDEKVYFCDLDFDNQEEIITVWGGGGWPADCNIYRASKNAPEHIGRIIFSIDGCACDEYMVCDGLSLYYDKAENKYFYMTDYISAKDWIFNYYAIKYEIYSDGIDSRVCSEATSWCGLDENNDIFISNYYWIDDNSFMGENTSSIGVVNIAEQKCFNKEFAEYEKSLQKVYTVDFDSLKSYDGYEDKSELRKVLIEKCENAKASTLPVCPQSEDADTQIAIGESEWYTSTDGMWLQYTENGIAEAEKLSKLKDLQAININNKFEKPINFEFLKFCPRVRMVSFSGKFDLNSLNSANIDCTEITVSNDNIDQIGNIKFPVSAILSSEDYGTDIYQKIYLCKNVNAVTLSMSAFDESFDQNAVVNELRKNMPWVNFFNINYYDY